jgi:ribulose-5-phosphate 4-epimerase/fuculose-1-phosphate aldolase
VAYDRDFAGMAISDDEGRRLASLLEDKSVLFMGNHGVTVVGDSVIDAVDKLYFLEKACESQVLAMSTGRPLALVDHETALKTRDQWESYPDLARDHFREIKRMLDDIDPTYRN